MGWKEFCYGVGFHLLALAFMVGIYTWYILDMKKGLIIGLARIVASINIIMLAGLSCFTSFAAVTAWDMHGLPSITDIIRHATRKK